MSDRTVAGRGRPPLPHLTAAVVVALAVLLCAPAHAAAEEYEIPDPIIKAYTPKGLSVSIPDSEGVELFAFHGNVNRELGEREAGEMSVDIRKKKGGLWTYENTQRRLKVGDVVNYWLYVQRFGRGYEQLGQTFVVSELVPKATPPPTPTRPAACDLSPTEVNGKPVCKGQVVFEDNFSNLDLSRWSHEVKISGAPDYEFCIYTQNPENSFTQKGFLHLSPTLTNDKYGADFVRTGKLQLEGCTAGAPNSDSCSREAMFSYILPPIVAARINTKNSFSFKYGTIEIRARLPRGDWIYPELWLQPTREEYGPGLASGRVVLAMARGNRRLTGSAPEHIDLSGKVMVAGALAGNINEGSATAKRKIFAKRSELGLWTEQFHNYTLLWTPDTMAFSVDGIEIGVARPEDVGGLIHGERDPWSQGSRIAPFDKEFYLSLGLAVGGVHAFPDGCRSGNHDKPWKNTGAKAMLNFWNNREVWHSTWNGQSDLLIDSVRVTALNN